MKFSEHWLRTMANPPIGSPELCERLTMAGLEVEEATLAAPPFSGVVVGNIERVDPHPNADRLRVCIVDVGVPARLTVVCGAPNAVAGMKAPCAMIGARLPAGLVIARASVRGVESQGMLCSAKELGITDDAAGLLALPADALVGANLRDALDLDDTLLTLKLTPNRADCLSLLGIAREVAAFTDVSVTQPSAADVPVGSRAQRDVRVEAPEACPRFVSRTIEGIDARAATPEWMKRRLERSGIRSISAVVDVTNYVMLELGQPLHAYDDRLLEGSIVVRFARPGEKLTLLNGQVLDLDKDLLLVADTAKPLGLAGIMGGEHSGDQRDNDHRVAGGRVLEPCRHSGKVAPDGVRERRRIPVRARRRLRRLQARGRARLTAHRRDLRRPRRTDRRRAGHDAAARSRSRATRARHASPRHRHLREDDRCVVRPAGLRVRARRRRFPRHAPFLSIRSRHRRRFHRGDRPSARLRRNPGGRGCARADDASGARRCDCADHRQARARRSRLAGSNHVQLRERIAGSHALWGDNGSPVTGRRARTPSRATST